MDNGFFCSDRWSKGQIGLHLDALISEAYIILLTITPGNTPVLCNPSACTGISCYLPILNPTFSQSITISNFTGLLDGLYI